jgi:hypothetical protein
VRVHCVIKGPLSFYLRVSPVVEEIYDRLAPSVLPQGESLQRLVKQQSFCLKDLLLRRFRPGVWNGGNLSCCRHPNPIQGQSVYSTGKKKARGKRIFYIICCFYKD